MSAQQLVRVPARQAPKNSLHPPHTEEKPQACLTGRRSLMAPVQSKERKAAALFLMASSSFECRPDRHQKTVCTRLAPHSSRKLPRLIEVIFVGSGAKQKRSWHGQGEPELASWKKNKQ